MKAIRFSWDSNKNASNCNKHGVSFEEASSVFGDLWARIIDDPDHSLNEQRFIILGMSNKLRILLVCHCYRGREDIIRIISARRATKAEAATYQNKRKG